MINSLVLLVAANLSNLDTSFFQQEIPKQLGFPPENIRIFSDAQAETQGYVAYDDEKIFIALSGTKSLRFTRKRKLKKSFPSAEKFVENDEIFLPFFPPFSSFLFF